MNGRLKLLLVTDAVGGVWAYSLELARALEPIGVDAVLAVIGPQPSPTQRAQAQAQGIRLLVTGLPLDWLETSPEDLKRAGDSIAAIASDEGADVVQTCSAALLAETQFDRPCVAVQHSCVATWWEAVKGDALPNEFIWRRELTEAGLNRASAVVAPSIAFAQQTSGIYKLSLPVLAVHNGLRPAFPPSSRRDNLVFTASRLWDEGKNVATLDAAAALLTVRFEAAGPTTGPNFASIVLDHLHGIGEVSGAQMLSILAAQPIFVSAALYEPFGLTALEAAHAGCALVLSDIPTHRELWDGAAIFVPARDEVAIASAIDELLCDSGKRRQFEQLARARAQLYTPERMACAMGDIYARIATPRFKIMPVALAGAAA